MDWDVTMNKDADFATARSIMWVQNYHFLIERPFAEPFPGPTR